MSPATDLAKFHEELRQKNLAVLFWSAIVFNVAYVGWIGFDYVLARDQVHRFAAYRLCAAGINTALVIAVHHPRLRRHTWEVFWLWLFTFGAFIAPMFGAVPSASFAPYVMGFTLILFGAGLLPFWPPRWALTNVLAVVGAAAVAIALQGVAARDLVTGVFFVVTGAGLAVVMAWYKYDFLRRDFFTNAELAQALARESEARERLRELDRLKNTFFANVSHELRTPLTLILAPVEELLEAPLDRDAKEQLGVVRRNAERLLRLIDDLLDLARLDARGLRLNLAEVDPRAVAQAVHEAGVATARARRIDYRIEIEPSERRLYADAHRLEIIVTNLAGNALKYTPDGGKVSLRVRDEEEEAVIEVEDTGPGIPAEELPRVFDRFFQLTPGDRRRQGGVGIGLALAKELTELHGGRLEARSREGEGTTFVLRIPFGREHIRPEAIERRRTAEPVRYGRRAGDPAAAQASATGGSQVERDPAVRRAATGGERSRPGRVVVVEDNDELRRFIVELLAQAGHPVTAARDGDEGLTLVRAERPDLVVSDVMMPGRSGADLCREIKADPALQATPVILLTARVGSEATLEGYAHGADDFVAKPFHPRVLLARVQAQLRLRALGLQLAEQEKLAAVGTLAAGILHEVRNPVNAILNAARALASGRMDAQRSQALVGVVGDAAGRIQEITSALDAHVRPADFGGGPAEVVAGIEATLRLLGHRLQGVTVHRRDGLVEAARVEMPAGPFNQVLLNLVDNALNAGARTLWLAVGRGNGDMIEIAIEDDGRGVPAELGPRLFEPFVSGGGGSGLGLYLSRQMLERHGGEIACAPRHGGGTRFSVRLPATFAG